MTLGGVDEGRCKPKTMTMMAQMAIRRDLINHPYQAGYDSGCREAVALRKFGDEKSSPTNLFSQTVAQSFSTVIVAVKRK